MTYPIATKPVCTVDGCELPTSCRGWCQAHYTRWKRHSDPLGGGTTPGEPLRFVAEAARSQVDTCIEWPFARTSAGYGSITVDGKRGYAHRAVLEAAVGPPPPGRPHAAHEPKVCHNPACVNPRHLRWASPSENVLDRELDGTASRGEDRPMAKLSESQVREIRSDQRTYQQIADAYGIGITTAWKVKNGITWRHVK